MYSLLHHVLLFSICSFLSLSSIRFTRTVGHDDGPHDDVSRWITNHAPIRNASANEWGNESLHDATAIHGACCSSWYTTSRNGSSSYSTIATTAGATSTSAAATSTSAATTSSTASCTTICTATWDTVFHASAAAHDVSKYAKFHAQLHQSYAGYNHSQCAISAPPIAATDCRVLPRCQWWIWNERSYSANHGDHSATCRSNCTGNNRIGCTAWARKWQQQ
jgi:hypothetical protein